LISVGLHLASITNVAADPTVNRRMRSAIDEIDESVRELREAIFNVRGDGVEPPDVSREGFSQPATSRRPCIASPGRARRSLDKVTIEMDRQPSWPTQRSTGAASTVPLLHAALSIQAAPRGRRPVTPGQACPDLGGRPRRRGDQQGQRHDRLPRAGPFGRLPGTSQRYLPRVHVSQKI
jgi:hypothetical protein